jgi:hypothetical protein
MTRSAARDDSFHPQTFKSLQNEDLPHGQPGDADFMEHLQTYRGFVKGVMLFAAHALVILLLLYYFLM